MQGTCSHYSRLQSIDNSDSARGRHCAVLEGLSHDGTQVSRLRYSTGLVSVIYNAQLETNGSPAGAAEQRGKKKRRKHRETLMLNAALRFVDAFAYMFD